jgi:NCS1 family nucleobase:cation symporter-1
MRLNEEVGSVDGAKKGRTSCMGTGMENVVLDFERLSEEERGRLEERIRTKIGDDPVEYQAVAPVLRSKHKVMSYWDLAMVWFGANIIVATWAVGALATTVFGLDPVSALVSIAIGNLIGGTMVGLTSMMGRNGMPQPMFSIPTFGHKGAKIPNTLLCFTTVGWTTANTVLSALAVFAVLKLIMPSISPLAKVFVILAITAVCVSIASTKFHVARTIEKYAAYVMVVVLVVLTYYAVGGVNWSGLASEFTRQTSFSYIMMFLSAMGAIGVGYLGTWSPYGADYARYVPMEKWSRQKGTFWSSLISGWFIATWLQGVGALFAYTYGTIDPAVHVVKTIPGFAVPALVVMIGGALSTVILNYLSAGVQLKALGISWSRRVCTWAVGIVVTFLALYSVLLTDISAAYHSFLVALLIWVVPWFVIQVMHYFLVAKGNYPVAAVYGLEKGYPDYDRRGLVTLLVGFVASAVFAFPGKNMLFGVIPLYSPLMEKYFYSGDLSYFVGGLVSFVVYWYIGVKPKLVAQKRAA